MKFKIGDKVKLINVEGSRYYDSGKLFNPELKNSYGIITKTNIGNIDHRMNVIWYTEHGEKETNVYTKKDKIYDIDVVCEVELYDEISEIENNLNKLFGNV